MSTHLKQGKLNQQRIKEIVALLDSLSTELSERLAIEDIPKSSPSNSSASYKSTTSFSFPPPAISVGDRVVITNKYRNLKGRTGVIQRITRTFYFLKLDGSDKIVQKLKSNVLRVSNEE